MYPYTISSNQITVIFRGKPWYVTKTESTFEDLKSFLKEGTVDDDYLESLVDKSAAIARQVSGAVEVKDGSVFFHGEIVNDTLALKMVDLVEEGFDITPWAKFMENLNTNPSFKSRRDLFNFLEKWDAPLTPDGCFIAFKNVRGNFYDVHSNSMDNSPGKVVSMPREEVNDDSSQTCSAGLHVCATEYLNSFYVHGGKTVMVKVNPRDVVSVPSDYNNAKMRTCQYEVMCEVGKERIKEIESTRVVFL